MCKYDVFNVFDAESLLSAIVRSVIEPPSCLVRRCDTDFSGERCQFITLPVEKPQEGYNRTTALAVVAVVLSSVCLIIIGLLLLLR